VAKAVGSSKATLCGIVRYGRWPATNVDTLRRALQSFLIRSGATAAHLALMRAAGFSTSFTRLAGGVEHRLDIAADSTTTTTDEDQAMLLANERLTPEARAHFNLTRTPFFDEINARDDVFQSPSTRYVRNALMDCAMHHGFVALVGESGSGKSTLREELEERIREERKPVIVIKPYTLAMEPTDLKGKPMKAGHIAEAIAAALAPSEQLKSSPQSRFAQMHRMLADSCAAGARHLIIIEEAHRMPLATLKHLKGFMELKQGLRRLVGVCLMGQTELGSLLAEQRPEIREIVQRCELLRMSPLDAELETYLKHKLARVGSSAAQVLADDAYDAIRARLIYMPRGGKPSDAVSTCYPLAVNNLVTRAMNAAALAGWPKVDANVVAGC